MYEVLLSKDARKALKELPATYVKNIRNHIDGPQPTATGLQKIKRV